MHRIALIYNESLTRRVLALWLQAAGYHVDLVPCDEALAQLSERELPDLILFDYDLPAGCGPTVLVDLRSIARLQHVPILAVSAGGPPPDRPEDLARATAWLTKPCDVGALSIWLVRLLGSPLRTYVAC